MKKTLLIGMTAALMLGPNAMAQNKTSNVYTESNRLKVEQVINAEQNTQVCRYLFAGYNTLCLPMSVSGDLLQQKGIKAERLEAIRQEGNVLCLYFADCTADGIEPGMPYLVFSERKQYLRIGNTGDTRTSDALQTIRLTDGQGNQVAFSSSWEKRQKDGLYGIPAKQNVDILESVLVRTTADLAFLPSRCGFSWEKQSPTADRLEIRHVSLSEATAIRQTLSVGNQNSPAYDLNGRQRTTTTKGVSIVNGRKVVR